MSELTSGQKAFVAAMLRCGSVATAAKEIEISRRTGWRWMGLPQVQAELAGAAGNLLDRLSDGLGGKVYEAIEVLGSIMSNPEMSAGVRVSAASAILSTAARVGAAYGAPEDSGQSVELEALWERIRLKVVEKTRL